MRRSRQKVADVEPGDLVVTSADTRIRVAHVRPCTDTSVIVHGTTATGPKSIAQPADGTVTRLD